MCIILITIRYTFVYSSIIKKKMFIFDAAAAKEQLFLQWSNDLTLIWQFMKCILIQCTILDGVII